ncbi:MAG: reverse transcriptase family protein, partial [Spiroplasma ixodetis]|nr:reverse transcriptase family protein [Spiroplasma ixodetis]
MIPKPNKPSTSTDGYRPITLLPCLSKVFERLILTKILNLLEVSPLHSRQYGFRKKLSPEKCVNDVLAHIQCERSKNTFVTAISLDISGAFDHAWWPLILHRFSLFNPPPFLLSILKSYLSDRHISFPYKNNLYSRSLQRGCPQGSVLGPTLWNILFNDLLLVPLPPGSALYCFADDTLLITSHDGYDEHITLTNLSLDIINRWMTKSHLSINASKTEAISFISINLNHLDLDPPSFLLNNCPIIPSSQLKYLGILLDNQLSF